MKQQTLKQIAITKLGNNFITEQQPCFRTGFRPKMILALSLNNKRLLRANAGTDIAMLHFKTCDPS